MGAKLKIDWLTCANHARVLPRRANRCFVLSLALNFMFLASLSIKAKPLSMRRDPPQVSLKE